MVPLGYSTCATKASTYQCKPCCTKDEGRPLEAAMQVEASNYRKLRRLRAGVVSVTEKAGMNASSRAQGDERK